MPPESRFRVELGVTPAGRPEVLAPVRDGLVDIVVLGDFQGFAANQGRAEHRDVVGSPVRVDADNLDRAIARFAPRLAFQSDNGSPVEMSFTELEDFHPDRMLDNLPALVSLLAVRERARRAGEPAEVLRRAAGLASAPAASSAKPAPVKPRTPPAPSGSVLEWILEGSPPSPSAAQTELGQFVSEVVAPHLVSEPDDERRALIREIEVAMASTLREVLHDPRFQALEALWRGTALLLQRLETGPSLRVHLLQATRAALLSDARDGVDPQRSELARALRSISRDGEPALLVVDLFFGANDEDIDLLNALGEIAHAQGALLLGGAAPRLVGLEGSAVPEGAWDIRSWDHEKWVSFRASPAADSVGLALPRILLRSAYGSDGEAIEAFNFEELSAPAGRDALLWGNAALACALLLGQALQSAGWPLQLDDRLDVEGLPVQVLRDGGETVLVPCTEWTARGDVVGALRKAGVMTFVPVGQGDVARLARFQTLGLAR